MQESSCSKQRLSPCFIEKFAAQQAEIFLVHLAERLPSQLLPVFCHVSTSALLATAPPRARPRTHPSPARPPPSQGTPLRVAGLPHQHRLQRGLVREGAPRCQRLGRGPHSRGPPAAAGAHRHPVPGRAVHKSFSFLKDRALAGLSDDRSGGRTGQKIKKFKMLFDVLDGWTTV